MRKSGCSESPSGGCLDSSISNIRSLFPSICSRSFVWKLPRTFWKPWSRKETYGGKGLHQAPWRTWLSPTTPDWGVSGHLQGSEARRSPLSVPHTQLWHSRSGDHLDSFLGKQRWSEGQDCSHCRPPGRSEKSHLPEPGGTMVQALGQSWFVTMEHLDIWGMRRHLESCPRSHNSVGLILCTVYRNKSNVFIIAW